jgi:hypothetical protein
MLELKSALESADRAAAALIAQRNAASPGSARDQLDMLRIGFLFFMYIIRWRIGIEVASRNFAYMADIAHEIDRVVATINQSIAYNHLIA